MRIGILTFHRAYNYGAVLQCYALQECLKEKGHKVEVIDYRQAWTEDLRKVFSLSKINQLRSHPLALLKYILSCNKRKKKLRRSSKIFDTFINNHFNLSVSCYDKNDIPCGYDAYIIGSDQLWGVSCTGGKLDEVYAGCFKHNNSRLIGYAISTNINSLNIIGKSLIEKYIKNFSNISLRERFAVDYFKNNGINNIELCIDPTLLSSTEIWDNIINDKWITRKFIFIYQARDYTLNHNLLHQKAQDVQKLLGKEYEIIDASDMSYEIGDFLGMIKYAGCILTTSFHATVFSILFKRPFYTFKLNDGADGRYIELLKSLKLENHCVDTKFKIKSLITIGKQTEIHLNEYKRDSISFFKKSLK